jgi:4-amino-4-deoxy-L-arabinose transferase-like glycosyltransferase
MSGFRIRDARLWIVVALAALVPRLLYVLLGDRFGLIGPTNPDSLQYQALARDLLSGRGWAPDAANATESLFRPPLYPWFLTLLYAIFGTGMAGVRVAQALLATGSALMISAIAGRAYGRRAAWIAGLLFALNPLLIMQTAELLTESLFIALYVGAFYAFVRALGSSPGWACACGGLLGLAILCRPTPLLVAPVLAGALLLRDGGIRQQVRRTALFAAGLLVVVLPWIARGAAMTGAWVPVATTGEFTLYLGNAPGWAERVFFDGEIPLGQEWDIAEYRKIREEPPGWFGREARRIIIDDPARFLRISVIRAGKFFKLLPEARGGAIRFVLAFTGYTFLFPIGVAGLVWAARRRDRFARATAVVLLFMCLVHVVSVPSVRYRFALVDAVLPIFAGGMLAALWLRVRRRSAG